MSKLNNFSVVLFNLAAINLSGYLQALQNNTTGLDMHDEKEKELYMLLTTAMNNSKNDWEKINNLACEMFKNV